MMDLLRSFSKGWLAKILIGLLVLSFAIWGISGSLFFGGQNTVAKVGETTVSATDFRLAYENQFANLSRNFGGRLTQAQAEALGLRQSVLEQVVAGAVMDENARKMGLGASDEKVALEIAQDPNLRDFSGNFSRATLQASLRQAGMTENEYIQNRKLVTMRNQFIEGTASSLSMPKAYSDALGMFQNEERVLHYVVLGAETAKDIPEPTNTQISEFYEGSKDSYIAPEYRKLSVMKIGVDEVKKPDAIMDEQLQAAYEARKDRLRRPERREVEQLVLNAGTEEAVAKQLEDGVGFETIVQEQGKTLSDINLGTLLPAGIPDEAVSKAAFEAELNKPTGIVQGVFGPVIVRVIKIEEEQTASFDDVKEQLRDTLATEQAGDELFALFDAVEDERGAGEPLTTISEKLELKLTTIEAIDAQGRDLDGNLVEDIPQLASLMREAFQAEPGDDTQALEIGEDGFMWFDVLTITPERQKPLDEVKDEVITAWKSAETDGQIEATAQKIIDQVKGGADFNTVLADMLEVDSLGQAISHETSEPVKRTARTDALPANAVQTAFSLPKDGMEVVPLGDNQFMVLKVADIQAGGEDPIEAAILERVDGEASQDIIVQMVNDLRSRESVSINQNAIEFALTPGGGQAQHGF